jgi:hypothetical protein
MALSVTEQSLFDNLRNTLVSVRPDVDKYNDIYEGLHRLKQLGLAIPPELERFSVILDWPRIAVDAVEQRLDVQGFRMPSGRGEADSSLWDVWQYNNMDERQTFAHTDALALSRSYVCVGTNPDDRDYPIITVESPREMVAVRDPRTHKVTAALRLYGVDPITLQDARATLYLPNQTRWLIRKGGDWVDEYEPDVHNLGAPPVVALVNRNRPTRPNGSIIEGVSEMAPVIPIADSASRAITNAQLLQETMVAPARGILGATKGDFVDQNGTPLSQWDAYFGSVWALGNANAKTFEFSAADMNNISTIINTYARLASGVSSLPIEYYGLNTENAPSAEGQRAGETRLIKKSERKQVSFGHGWESVMRLVTRFRDGEWSDDATRMETIWRDAGTPTTAQVTDAVVKRYQAGLVDWETAQELMGESPAAIDRMRGRRDADLDMAERSAQASIATVTNLGEAG